MASQGATYSNHAEVPDAFPKMIFKKAFLTRKAREALQKLIDCLDVGFTRRNSLEPGAAQLHHATAPSLVILMRDIGANGDLLPFH